MSRQPPEFVYLCVCVRMCAEQKMCDPVARKDIRLFSLFNQDKAVQEREPQMTAVVIWCLIENKINFKGLLTYEPNVMVGEMLIYIKNNVRFSVLPSQHLKSYYKMKKLNMTLNKLCIHQNLLLYV